MKSLARLTGAVAVAGALFAAQPAQAQLHVTAAGAALGFQIDSVITGFPFSGLGPIGITVTPNGNILANSVGDGFNYVFNDVNNQTFADHIAVGAQVTCCAAYATANGWAWGGTSNTLTRFNNDGTIAQSYNGIGLYNGLWTNPVTGHLIGAYGSLYDIDVSDINNPIARLIPNTTQGDGLTVSPDGTIVYTSDIRGYLISDGTLVYSNSVGGSGNGADGMGIITSNNPNLNGKLVVNSYSTDSLYLIDVTIPNDPGILIATGGGRGDYTTNDPNGSLLVTSGDSIMRLSCGSGCAVGSTPPPATDAPEPASLALLGAGLAALGAARRRRG